MDEFYLSDAQKQHYLNQGYVVINDFVSQAICSELIARADQLMTAFNPETGKTVFSTQDQRHAKHQYFLNSGYDIRFFFEANALDEQGNLKYEKKLSINKIGHALHDLDVKVQT